MDVNPMNRAALVTIWTHDSFICHSNNLHQQLKMEGANYSDRHTLPR